jgi:hypothetical protein
MHCHACTAVQATRLCHTGASHVHHALQAAQAAATEEGPAAPSAAPPVQLYAAPMPPVHERKPARAQAAHPAHEPRLQAVKPEQASGALAQAAQPRRPAHAAEPEQRASLAFPALVLQNAYDQQAQREVRLWVCWCCHMSTLPRGYVTRLCSRVRPASDRPACAGAQPACAGAQAQAEAEGGGQAEGRGHGGAQALLPARRHCPCCRRSP